MAAEPEKFSSFDNPCSDLSVRLPFTSRAPFGVPTPAAHPFVAHFYPLINSVGTPSPYLPPETVQTSSNPGSVFASVAARRPDLLYTELCKNLFKANGFPPSNILKNNQSEFSSQNSSHGRKDFIDHNFDFNSSKAPFKRRSDILAQDKGTNLSYHQALTATPTALQSFCEGFYRGLTPNDYLLRLQAEQHFAAATAACKDRRKQRTFFQQTGHPYSSHHTGISTNPDNSYTKTAKQLPSSSNFSFPFNTQPTEKFLNSKSESFPTFNRTKSSPQSNDSTSPPLDFSLSNHLSPSPPKFVKSHASYGVSISPSKRRHMTESKPCNSTAESQYLFKVSMTTTAHMTNGMSTRMAQTEKVILENDDSPGQRKKSHSFPDADNNEVVANSPEVVHDNSISSFLAEPRIKRKRRLGSSLCETCPVCGVTIRAAEMKQHFMQEISKLEKIANEVLRNSRKNCHDRKSPGSSSGCSQSSVTSSSVTSTSCKKITDMQQQVHQVVNKENRQNTFQKVRGNRMERLNSRVGQCMRNQSMLWNPSTNMNGVRPHLDMLTGKLNGPTWLNYSAGRDHGKMNSCGQRMEVIQCPVCNKSLNHLSNHEQISDHVIQCAGPTGTTIDFPNHAKIIDQVDIDGDDDGAFGEEYEWCGQNRVRATALVTRDVLASSPGFQIIRNTENEDSDQDLNVETDDTGEFGPAQFTDTDLVACPSDEDGTVYSNEPATSGDPYGSEASPSSLPAFQVACRSPSIVVQALKMKIQQLEQEKHGNRCLICMEPHTNPLVSIQCWHVHCDKCWMRALGVKKLCPQCNVITPASQLRRIYL